MKTKKPSYQAICPGCGRPVVVPRRDAEGSKTYTFACCSGLVSAPVELVEGEVPDAKQRKPLARSRKRRRSSLDKRLADRWAKEVRRLPCASCGRMTDWARGIVVEGHHIVRQALLRDRGRVQGWDDEELTRRLWDTRNRLPLCGDCHRGHHSKMKKLAWKLVRAAAPKVEQFARETGLMREARRDYG